MGRKAKTYSTPDAAKELGISLRTLNRWMASGKIRASQSLAFGHHSTLWRWTEADIRAAFKVKATLKRGRKRQERDA